MDGSRSRPQTDVVENQDSFVIDSRNRSYKHQYSNIYFTRLHQLKAPVQEAAARRWNTAPESPQLVPRLLDVVKGRPCYIVGTVYLDMPLKPNVLEDLGRDRSIPAPPQRLQYWSEEDSVFLEDESGRIRLAGDILSKETLVTGIIIAVLGMESGNGEFSVLDICFAGLPVNSRPPTIQSTGNEWIALISGLDIGSDDWDEAGLHLLSEYLSGELIDQEGRSDVASVTRAIIVGNLLASGTQADLSETIEDMVMDKSGIKKTSNNRGPNDMAHAAIETLSGFLMDIGSSMPVHVLPGWTDPSGPILPQQAFPRAMLGPVSQFETFYTETNPAHLHLSPVSDDNPAWTRHLLITSGQTIEDMLRYVKTPPTSRLDLAEGTLLWRHLAPTAPDTLWCHPYFSTDPFVLATAPDVYIIGNQSRAATRTSVSNTGDGHISRSKTILVPRFSRTGSLVLLNLSNLETRVIKLYAEP